MPKLDADGSVSPQSHFDRERYSVLDGLRGLAIIGVLLTHAADLFQSRLVARIFETGWTGVELFFVLSGFLITGILIDTKSALNRARSFFGRRVIRIFPIYYLTLCLVFIAQTQWPWVREAIDLPSSLDRLSNVFFFQDLASFWHKIDHETMIGQFWSLAVEAQFYLLWPLFIWRVQTKTIYVFCGAALCLTLPLRVIAGSHFGFGAWIQFFPLTRGDGLLVGSALAALLASHGHFSKKFLAAFAVVGSLALLVVVFADYREFFYGGPYMFTIGFSGLAILFGVLAAYCLQFGASPIARLFKMRWLRSFGVYSYGLYVFHLPIYFFFDHLLKERFGMTFPLPPLFSVLYLALQIGVSYAISWLSYNYFEQRFRRLKRFLEPEFGVTRAFTEPVELGGRV